MPIQPYYMILKKVQWSNLECRSQAIDNMSERENKKFERNLGKVGDLRDARLRNAVELRKNAQDDRLKKGRGVTEASSPLAAVQPVAAGDNGGAVPAAPARAAVSVAEIPQLFLNIQSHDAAVVLEATRGFRRLLSLQKDPPITEVVETGVVPMLVRRGVSFFHIF
jgi:hypothetical protein